MKLNLRSWASSYTRFLFFLAAGCGWAAWAADPPVFVNPMILPGGQVQVQLATVVGESYTIEVSTNLVTWEPVGSVPTVDTNLVTLVDEEPVTSSPCRFYRAKVGLTRTYGLWFNHYAQAGNFSGGLTPVVSYPISIAGYTAGFDVENDPPYPEASQVFFSGPSGSGLNNAAADPMNSWADEEGASYHSPVVSSPALAPGGDWTIQYKGSNYVFNMANPQAASRLVLPVPTFVLSNGFVQSVSWVYRAADTGAPLTAPPAFMTGIQVQIDGNGGRIYDSPWSDYPAITSHTLLEPILWSDVSGVNLAYDDSLDNHYVVFFRKP
ncbi:MAG TPA: hypothetical protein PKI20_12010 [Verrucomicrobiota bacterium]|mgnify:FL=1|nr:hypothetical protein [Verrucomicrobiota bacterium]HQL78507.1 hypothetical protein [Verrucomicrobiota bacterium]